jgi:hypothetical protein
MAYSTSNPPVCTVPSLNDQSPSIWMYRSADASTVVDNASYFTNGGNLGMKVDDVIFVVCTATTPHTTTSHTVESRSTTYPYPVDLTTGVTLSSTDTD